VLEITRSRPILVRCLASPAALDALACSGCTFVGRIAPDELLLWYPAPEGDSATIVGEVAAELGGLDPTSIIADHTGAFAVFTLSGDTDEAMSRLSAIAVPAVGFAQGLVAGTPAKLLVASDCIHVLVPSTLADSVRVRLLSACADLVVVERTGAPLVPAGRQLER